MDNKRKLYEKFLDNRFKISGMIIVLLTVIGYFLNSKSIIDWITCTDTSCSLWWNIKFFALLLGAYEIFLMITDNKKGMSLIASICLVFSGTVQWNFNNIDALIIGIIISVLLQKLFDSKNRKQKILISLGIIISVIAYMFSFRPYAIAFGYVFVALFCWIVLKNKYKIKNDKDIKILGLITVVLSIIFSIIILIFFNNNNVEYIHETGRGISLFFTYLYNVTLPFNNLMPKELLAGIISIFPIPMIITLSYMYKNEKHTEYFLPIIIVMVFETVYCISGFPEIINKITFLSQVNPMRVLPAVHLINYFTMFYFLGNVKEELFEIKYAMRLTVFVACILAFINLPEIYSGRVNRNLLVCELTMFTFLLLNYSNPKYRTALLFFLLIFTLIGGVTVNIF